MVTGDGHRTPVTTFEWEGETSVGTAVVRAVAAVSGSEPTAMTPLHDAVDPDAVDALFDSDRSSGTRSFEFSYCGYRISLSASGEGAIYED